MMISRPSVQESHQLSRIQTIKPSIICCHTKVDSIQRARQAIQVAKAGYTLPDGNACRDKINRSRKQYRDIRDQTRKSGQGTEDDIPFWFNNVKTIMGDKPATCLVATLDTGTFNEHEGVTRPSSVSSDIDNHDEDPIIHHFILFYIVYMPKECL